MIRRKSTYEYKIDELTKIYGIHGHVGLFSIRSHSF